MTGFASGCADEAFSFAGFGDFAGFSDFGAAAGAAAVLVKASFTSPDDTCAMMLSRSCSALGIRAAGVDPLCHVMEL